MGWGNRAPWKSRAASRAEVGVGGQSWVQIDGV